MSDLLQELAGALRETSEPEAPAIDRQAAATRARVLNSVRKSRSRWLSLTRVLVPLAAAFIGGTAWAAATGQLPRPVEAALEALRSPEAKVAAAAPARSHEPKAASESAPPPSVIETPVEPAPIADPPAATALEALATPVVAPARPATTIAAPRPRATAPATPAATAPAETIAAPAAAAASEPAPVDPADALYATAHRLHFVQHDSAGALTAWNAYLRAAPGGRFGVEAAYNRAICLVRLGRTSEAKAALTGFASGAYGGYRRAEAKALLDAMQSAAP